MKLSAFKMKNHRWILIIIINISLLVSLTACHGRGNSSSEADTLIVESLSAYFLELPQGYNGDNAYYHVVNSIVLSTEEDEISQVLTGEVFNDVLGSSSRDYTFEQSYIIKSDQMIIQHVGDKLNDTDYDEEVALTYPLEIGQSWTFDTKRDGSKVKVRGEITALTDESVTVNFTDNKGYREIRVLTKGLGTTDFYKYYQYDDLVVVTGYHLDANFVFQKLETNPDVKLFEDMISRRVPYKVHELLTAYNLAYESFVNTKDDAIYNYLTPESPLRDQLTYIERLDSEIDFVGFKTLEIEGEGNTYTLEVLEAYFLGDDFMTTYMTYELKESDNAYYIDDAYATP